MSECELALERSSRFFEDESNKHILITPAINKDFWKYRVILDQDQAIVGFPKFTTVGIGFALEEDWNTNLPYTCEANMIAAHIWHNRKYDSIKKSDVIKAIKMIQDAVKEDKEESR